MNLMPTVTAETSLDQLWYKDAIIYQLHVKAFADSNDDGIGDFNGLTAQLDYLHDLGVPHVDYSVDTPLQPGQSGSPVFLIDMGHTGMEPEVRFSLIGLLHAQEKGAHLMVPYSLWAGALAALPSREHAAAMGGQ